MEKRKVYVVQRHYWDNRYGDSDYSYEVLDSIWSRQEDAKHRIDDLANEYVRQQWYDQVCDLEDIEDFECKTEWSEDGLSVKMSTDPCEENTFYVDEFELDPLLPDFEGD